MSSPFAVLFPGQGSQEVGMGRDLVRQKDETALALFDAASEIAGVDIGEIAMRGPERVLSKTAYLQPALTVVALSLYKRLAEAEMVPSAVAGHSVGELPALSACGMANAVDMVKLAALRGRLMADAAAQHPGAMAALLGAGVDPIRQALSANPPIGVLDIAAVNGPTQVVLSGDENAVDEAVVKLGAALGIKGTRLRVSGAWHSPHMADAVLPLLDSFKQLDLQPARCPMVFNRDGLVSSETGAVPGLLAEQLIRPVRFDQVVGRLLKMGIRTFVEVGPGRVLRGLVRLNCNDLDVVVHSISDSRSLKRTVLSLKNG